jgi:hypothetical protein
MALKLCYSPKCLETERLVGSLPIVEAGLLDFEVIPLRPYAGLRRLFENPT